MQPDDAPSEQTAAPEPAIRASRSPISVALLAAVACMPIVVAAGFLCDRPEAPSVPNDISIVALRGVLDGAGVRPETPGRAGY